MNNLLPILCILTVMVSSLSAQAEYDEDSDIIKEFYESGPDSREPSSSSSPILPSKGPNPAKKPVTPDNPPLPLNKGPTNSQNIDTVPQSSDTETLKENKPCQCVKYFLCNIDNETVVDNGDVLGLIDIRLGATKASPCPHYFDICCQDVKEQTTEPTEPVKPKTFKHSVCGKRNIGGVGFRITGAEDHESQFGEFPWMVAIVKQEEQVKKPPLNIYLCGGSLIHPSVVMTAAHCVYMKEARELKVRLGEWDTQTPHELYPHQDRLVSRVVVHEKYYGGALYNDIALLFLEKPADFAPNVDTICLPPMNERFDGQTCYASGWGKDSFGQEGKYQVILKKIELPVVPNTKCQSALRRTRLGPHFRLHESFICAGGEAGRDTCRGDGGSPLVCQLPDSPYYVQVGMVAWGIGCGDEGTPGVYVDVPKFVPWITTKMTAANLDTRYFKVSS